MGDRAIITTEDRRIGVYVHWDGSPDRICGFLAYCDLMGFRSPEIDNYGWAQLIKIIGNYIDENRKSDGLSLGICRDIRDSDSPGDNGIYIIKDWAVQEQIGILYSYLTDAIPLLDMLRTINCCQPFHLTDDELVHYANTHNR